MNKYLILSISACIISLIMAILVINDPDPAKIKREVKIYQVTGNDIIEIDSLPHKEWINPVIFKYEKLTVIILKDSTK